MSPSWSPNHLAQQHTSPLKFKAQRKPSTWRMFVPSMLTRVRVKLMALSNSVLMLLIQRASSELTSVAVP